MPAQPLNDLETAAKTLRAGGLVAFPTETVYGIGADATNGRAVAEIYAVKGRPQFNPLIIHFADRAAAKKEVEWNEAAETLASAFWPGPLSLVLPRLEHSRISLLASAGLPTLAVRVPRHPVAQALLRESGAPVAAPSANRSGHVSPTLAAHVRQEFGDSVPILDGGACAVGLESTIISLAGDAPLLLRPGAVTEMEISEVLGRKIPRAEKGKVLAPGMMASHYAPSLPVRLNAKEARPGEALLGFGPAPGATLNLSGLSDLREAAANLFAYLRALDRKEFSGIAVMPIPEEGLGAAINDRLARASMGRVNP